MRRRSIWECHEGRGGWTSTHLKIAHNCCQDHCHDRCHNCINSYCSDCCHNHCHNYCQDYGRAKLRYAVKYLRWYVNLCLIIALKINALDVICDLVAYSPIAKILNPQKISFTVLHACEMIKPINAATLKWRCDGCGVLVPQN